MRQSDEVWFDFKKRPSHHQCCSFVDLYQSTLHNFQFQVHQLVWERSRICPFILSKQLSILLRMPTLRVCLGTAPR
jgi:hypothetical protein